MPKYAILRFEKHKGHPAAPLEAHHERQKEKYASNPDIDTERTKYNFHIAIISKDVFLQVQEQIASRRRSRKDGQTQIFAGLIKCADCGWSLAYGENRQNKTPYGYYHCSKNGQGTKQCSHPTELTAELLNTVIEKIVVHEAVKGTDGSRKQKVDIYYRFIGKID
ncbi:MAG: DUF4368 domain-containing protein [Lachnospiraceae bacterium]|nr:DUF4368 domain-containing protein [Lachnospiraceae bacterium]